MSEIAAISTRHAELEQTLERIARDWQPVALASSLSAEDMVLTDAIARLGLPIGVFAIDTGRLHRDTLELLETIGERYALQVKIYRPDIETLAEYVAAHGRDAFYGSAELRKRCCEIRKLVPLRRALQGKRLWITGLRREQSAARADVAVLANDSANGLMKLNPLADWSEQEVWAYVEKFDVPTNPLHGRGYPSIGCAPCTRAVQPGEDPRAGRWWWEQPDSRECGLHVDPQGRLVRKAAAAVHAKLD